MARKEIAEVLTVDDPRLLQVIDEWKGVQEIKAELARSAYDAQDEETQRVIGRIHKTLMLNAAGVVKLQIDPPRGPVATFRVEQPYIDWACLTIAVEIFKDLALLDIRIANFNFPKAHCYECGRVLKSR